jgi:hypothetical protein
MSSQADSPCTLLYHMNGALVVVGKGTIMKPKDRLFHSRQIPDDTLRVSMASVKAGYEGLPLPLQSGGEDDETPTQLGQCKNWPILWPKNLIHVEVAGRSKPTGPHQEGMTTTPPTQLQPSSMLPSREVERHEEGGPTVPADDDNDPMEEDMIMTWMRRTLSHI